MQTRELTDGESASTPYFLDDRAPASMVFFPMAGAGFALNPQMVDQVYRMALEWAVRTLQPSLYDQAQRVHAN